MENTLSKDVTIIKPMMEANKYHKWRNDPSKKKLRGKEIHSGSAFGKCVSSNMMSGKWSRVQNKYNDTSFFKVLRKRSGDITPCELNKYPLHKKKKGTTMRGKPWILTWWRIGWMVLNGEKCTTMTKNAMSSFMILRKRVSWGWFMLWLSMFLRLMSKEMSPVKDS